MDCQPGGRALRKAWHPCGAALLAGAAGPGGLQRRTGTTPMPIESKAISASLNGDVPKGCRCPALIAQARYACGAILCFHWRLEGAIRWTSPYQVLKGEKGADSGQSQEAGKTIDFVRSFQ